jgi:hypothetical protein
MQDALVDVPLANCRKCKDVHASGLPTTHTWWERQRFLMTHLLSLTQIRTLGGLVKKNILGVPRAPLPFTAHVATMVVIPMAVPQETQKAMVAQGEVTDMDRMPGH